jgi:hypothetical protein
MLGERAAPVGIEGVRLADARHDLRGAGDAAGFGILQHQHVAIVVQNIPGPREGGVRLGQLGAQRCAIGGRLVKPLPASLAIS